MTARPDPQRRSLQLPARFAAERPQRPAMAAAGADPGLRVSGDVTEEIQDGAFAGDPEGLKAGATPEELMATCEKVRPPSSPTTTPAP